MAETNNQITRQFTDEDMEIQMRVKDVFDPEWILNPAKVFPMQTSHSRRTSNTRANLKSA